MIRAKINSDHASDRTGFIGCLNSSPTYYHSKKESRLEPSSFCSELIAMEQLCDCLRGLRCRLQIMRVSHEGPAYTYDDNHSVLCNILISEMTLKKKNSSMFYHLVWTGMARDKYRTV